MSLRVVLFFGGLLLLVAGIAMWSVPGAFVATGGALIYLGRP